MTTPIALSIAGSDPSGGAGIQADLKTFSALSVYGAAALTLLTVQNTRGVRAVETVAPDLVQGQIAAVLDDLEVGAVKIGALGSGEVALAVAEALEGFGGPVVLDPVMVAKSGDPLLPEEAVAVLAERLLPRADLVTPNLPEAAKLAGAEADQSALGRAILDRGARAVLVKGGHARDATVTDLLMRGGAEPVAFEAPRIETRNTHGTGCTLSSAIAAHLARGAALEAAVEEAHRYLAGAIRTADTLRVGQGHGPVHHFHGQWGA